MLDLGSDFLSEVSLSRYSPAKLVRLLESPWSEVTLQEAKRGNGKATPRGYLETKVVPFDSDAPWESYGGSEGLLKQVRAGIAQYRTIYFLFLSV